MNILLLAYREWGISACLSVIQNNFHDFTLVKSKKEYEDLSSKKNHFDIIMLAGWSWKIENSVVNNSYVVGLHPSDLPNFKGGSPIQNQILQGITKTKASLFKLTECFDDGPVLLQTELSLKGSINNIFKNLKAATITLFNRFLKEETFNKNPPASKNGGSYYKRLSKEDSRVFPKCFLEMNALTLYNLMRCREDPYPNVFIEDKTGRLLFKKVDFIENEDLPSI